MRPGQNKRLRGRNNRKGPNPLTRSYESNGPDVKIRGTAHHVAEKYLQLARDAQSSGDPVMAESYLQHAEHYFRLIAAAQLAQQQSQPGYMRQPGEADSDDDDDDDVGGLPDRFASPAERFTPPPFSPQQPQMAAPQPVQQPFPDRQNYNNSQNNAQGQDRQYQDRGDRPQRNERTPYQDRNDNRQPRPDRPYQQDRGDQNRFNQNRGPRDNRPQRDFRADAPRGDAPRQDAPRQDLPRNDAPREVPREQAAAAMAIEPAALPSFITTPVRIPVSEPAAQSAANGGGSEADVNEPGGFHLRPRRRRRNRGEAGGETGDSGAPEAGRDDVPAGE